MLKSTLILCPSVSNCIHFWRRAVHISVLYCSVSMFVSLSFGVLSVLLKASYADRDVRERPLHLELFSNHQLAYPGNPFFNFSIYSKSSLYADCLTNLYLPSASFTLT